MKKNKTGTICLYAAAILWTICCLFPLAFSALSSFKNTTQILSRPFALPEQISFENYLYAIEHAQILRAVWNSIVYAFLATAIILLVSLLAAYALTRLRFRLAPAFSLFYVAGITLPIYAALVPLSQIMSTLHLRDTVIGLVLVYVAVNLSFSVYMLSGYMRSISRELDEAARIDGCTTGGILFRIIMPLMKPAATSAAIITFLRIYNDLILAILFLSDKKLQTVSIALLSFKSESYVDYGGSFAGILLSILPLVVLYILFQNKIIGGMTDGAVKG